LIAGGTLRWLLWDEAIWGRACLYNFLARFRIPIGHKYFQP
jgi:hypothetical protein